MTGERLTSIRHGRCDVFVAREVRTTLQLRDDAGFPFGVADYLAGCRARGLSFDTAWNFADLDAKARAADFGRDRQNAASVESVLTFTKRHFRAAYDRYAAMRYCVHIDCPYLALFGEHCALHADEERIAS